MIRSANRVSSFFSQWMAEVVRQPWLMASLVAGPFLVLLAFGQGVKLGVPKPRTLLVVPAQDSGARLADPVPEDMKRHLDIVGETANLDEATQRLREGDVDLVAVLPPDPLQQVRKGEHATVRIYTNEIDPVLKSYAATYLNDQIGEINRRAVREGIAEAQTSLTEVDAGLVEARAALEAARAAQGDTARSRAAAARLRTAADRLAIPAAATGATVVLPGLAQEGDTSTSLQASAEALRVAAARLDAGNGSLSAADLDAAERSLTNLEDILKQARTIPPEVLAGPFDLDVRNIARFEPNYISFYAPAVVALLVQHLAVTLGALSMARIRLLGIMELLQTAPARPGEVVTGNFISYGFLSAVAAALLTGLLVFALGVPMLGSWLILGGTLLLLILASLGLGFVISMLSTSEQQAAQLAMLVLIASVFFSGFVVSLNTIVWPVRAISFMLPATYAIRTLQDVMLRGLLREPLDVAVLGLASIALFLLTIRLFRREYRPR